MKTKKKSSKKPVKKVVITLDSSELMNISMGMTDYAMEYDLSHDYLYANIKVRIFSDGDFEVFDEMDE